MEEEKYWLECDVCDSVVKLTVLEGDDAPSVCPMCGSTADFEELDDE